MKPSRTHRSVLRPFFAMLMAACLCAWHAGAASAQESQAQPQTQPVENGDPLGRDTPRGSFTGFLDAAENFEWERAAAYLDLRNLPADVRRIDGATLAQELDFVLKRSFATNPDLLSVHPEGQPFDGLPEYRDELARIKTVDGDVVLLLQHVPGPGTEFIWKISNATVAQIPMLYEMYSYPAWVDWIRSELPQDISFLGWELFKWVIVLAFLLVLVPLLVLSGWLLARLISKPSRPLYTDIKKTLMGPLVALITAYSAGWMATELGLGATAQKVVGARTMLTIAWVWMIWKMIDLWRARRRLRYERSGRTDSAVLGRPLANTLKLASLVIALVIWLTNAGFNLTTVLAGLGVGGVAVALALQKPIEDLLGALSLYSQQQLQTGDFCRYQNTVGQIEEIGLRTTRFRTLANTLVSVPNSQLALGVIENITARTKILYDASLRLRYDTSADQLQRITADLTKLCHEDERIEGDTVRIRVTEFADNAIIISLRIFALTRSFDEYLEITEAVNLAILRIIQAAGAHFAQGAQSVFIENTAPAGSA